MSFMSGKGLHGAWRRVIRFYRADLYDQNTEGWIVEMTTCRLGGGGTPIGLPIGVVRCESSCPRMAIMKFRELLQQLRS